MYIHSCEMDEVICCEQTRLLLVVCTIYFQVDKFKEKRLNVPKTKNLA